jgi:outer membrane protein OmpA-like peptidoglycan-associated protein
MIRKLFILFFFLLSVVVSDAQRYPRTTSNKALKHYNNGKQHFEFFAMREAVSELKQAVEIDSNFIDAQLLLAEVSSDVKNYPLAIKSYLRVIEIDPHFFPNAMYDLAQLERLSGLYEEAKGHFERFLEMEGISQERKEDAMNGIMHCEFSIEAMNNPVPFNPVNLGPSINSSYDEYWPSITADGLTFVVTVQIPKTRGIEEFSRNMQEDFFISRWENGKWTPKKSMGKPINTDLNEGAQSLSADGHFMFFTACNRPDGIGSCDIYFSIWTGDRWSPPRNIGKPINSAHWDAQPSISPDGKTIYFCSRRPGGKGKIDLWQSTVTEDGYWGEPENLGDQINTPGDEMSPFIHPDNQTLYFSSNGLPGLGDFDLFISRKNETGAWGPAKNLGYPINSHFEEIGMIVNAKGNKAYYSSTRMSNSGKDIFEFELYDAVRPGNVTYMKGSVFDRETSKPLIAKFELIDLITKKIVMQAFSDPRGEFLVCIPTNQDYALNVSRDGYLFYSDNFSLKGIREITDPFLKDIPLQPLKTGEKVILKNIFYQTDSYTLLPKSEAELNKVIQFLEANPEIRIEISGHTDNVGTPEYNQVLSENRARSVYQYLIDHNIDPARLVFRGYGLEKPVDTNESDEGRAQNRRTELKIL